MATQRSTDSLDIDVSVSSEKSNMYISAEAKAILDSTPELVTTQSRLSELDISETPNLDIRSAQKVQQHNVSLFAEMEALDTPKEEDLIMEQRGLKEFDRLLTANKDLIDLR